MNVRRGYKKYTRVGDFDPPTHQPTNLYVVQVPILHMHVHVGQQITSQAQDSGVDVSGE